MEDLCISLSAVKPGFLPAVKTLVDINGDGKVCKLENPEIDDMDFESFVNIVRITPEVKAAPSIEIPEMVDIPGSSSRIMKGEVTVGLFKQVMQGYEITDHNADKLKAILADPSKAGEALTYVSLIDAREFAKRLSEQTGRKFRVQTEAEWEAARNELSGNSFTWMKTKHDESTFVLRHLVVDDRDFFRPGNRFFGSAVRLVEDR